MTIKFNIIFSAFPVDRMRRMVYSIYGAQRVAKICLEGTAWSFPICCSYTFFSAQR